MDEAEPGMSVREIEALGETLEMLGDDYAVAQIRQSLQDINEGNHSLGRSKGCPLR